jgi:hypothetical protein
MKIDNLKLMSGVPIFLEEIGLSINQPRIKDIAVVGEVKFYQALSYFLINKQKLDITIDISDYDLFMKIINQDQSIQKDVSDIFILTIDGLDSIKFYDTFIIISAFEQECIIDEPKFLIIKEALIQIFCLGGSSESDDLNPANKLAQEIAEKIRRRRERLAGSKDGNKSDNIFGHLISILTIGSNSFSVEDCLNFTVYQIFNLIKRFTMYQEYNMQIQALMQGAKDIDVVEWTKQL